MHYGLSKTCYRSLWVSYLVLYLVLDPKHIGMSDVLWFPTLSLVYRPLLSGALSSVVVDMFGATEQPVFFVFSYLFVWTSTILCLELLHDVCRSLISLIMYHFMVLNFSMTMLPSSKFVLHILKYIHKHLANNISSNGYVDHQIAQCINEISQGPFSLQY
jgi:hypothetical protein